jgi:hypothetical protein
VGWEVVEEVGVGDPPFFPHYHLPFSHLSFSLVSPLRAFFSRFFFFQMRDIFPHGWSLASAFITLSVIQYNHNLKVQFQLNHTIGLTIVLKSIYNSDVHIKVKTFYTRLQPNIDPL